MGRCSSKIPTSVFDVADELVLVLSDIAIEDGSGELQSPDSGGAVGALFGREGNHLLVNGRIKPTLTVRSGALQRWRIVNSAKSRYFSSSWTTCNHFCSSV